MTELTIQPPVPRIRLYTLPADHTSKYVKLDDVPMGSPPYGYTDGRYAYSEAHLTEYLTPTLVLSVGPSMFKDFSIKRTISTPGHWEATIEMDADFTANPDNETIIEKAIEEGAFALVYFATGDEDVTAIGEIMGWGATNRVRPATFQTSEPQAWTQRGMVGPVKAKINKDRNQTVTISLEGDSSLQWLADTDHKKYGDGDGDNLSDQEYWQRPENYTPGEGNDGDARALKFVNMVYSLFRENCEFDPDETNEDEDERRPTQIGRMLIYPRITQAAWNRIRDDANPRDLRLKPGPGANVLKSLQQLCAAADCFVYDEGIDAVIDTARNSGRVLGPDILSTGEAEYGRPKRNRFEVYHKDTVDDFSVVVDITADLLTENTSLAGIDAAVIGAQEVWGVISGPPIPSRAPLATVVPASENGDTTSGSATGDATTGAPPVPDIGRAAKEAIMLEQAYEEATKTIISRKGAAVIQTEAGHLIGSTIKMGENYDLDLFGLGEGKPGYLRNQILYEWAADSQGDTDTYAYTPGFSPIANILPGAGFRPAHAEGQVEMTSDLAHRLFRLEEIESSRSMAIEIATPAEDDGRPQDGVAQPIPIPAGVVAGNFKPFGLWSDGSNAWVTNDTNDATLHALNIFSDPIHHVDTMDVHLTNEPANTSSRRGTSGLPDGGYVISTNQGVFEYSNTGRYLRMVSNRSNISDVAYAEHLGQITTNTPNFSTFSGGVLFGVFSNVGLLIAWIYDSDASVWREIGAFQTNINPSSGVAVSGENIWVSSRNIWNGYTAPSSYSTGATPRLAQKTSISRTLDTPSGFTNLLILSGWASGATIYSILSITSTTTPPVERRVLIRNTIDSLVDLSQNVQSIIWSAENYNPATSRYEFVLNKSAAAFTGQALIDRFTFEVAAASVVRGTTSPGGAVTLSYTEDTAQGASPVGTFTDSGGGRGSLLVATDTALGAYTGQFLAVAAPSGTIPSARSTRNIYISVVEDADPLTIPFEVSPSVYPFSYVFIGFGNVVTETLIGYIRLSESNAASRIADSGDWENFRYELTPEHTAQSSRLVRIDTTADSQQRFAVYQIWTSPVTFDRASFNVLIRAKGENRRTGERRESPATTVSVTVVNYTGTHLTPDGYFLPTVNTEWDVASDKVVRVGEVETFTLGDAFNWFGKGITGLHGPLAPGQGLLGPISQRPDVAGTTLFVATQLSNNVIRFQYTATGTLGISLEIYDGRNFSPIRTIRRTIRNRTTAVSGTGWWLLRSGETNAVPLSNLTANVVEGSARARLFADDTIYFAYRGSNERAVQGGNADVLAYEGNTGALVSVPQVIRSFTTAQGTLTGLEIQLFSVGTDLDYESQNQARFRVSAAVPDYVSAQESFDYFSDEFHVTYNIQDINEPPAWADGWKFPDTGTGDREVLTLPANSSPPHTTYDTTGWVTDDDATNSQMTLVPLVSFVTARPGVSPNLTATWARSTEANAPLGAGTLSLTSGAAQTGIRLQLTWTDGNTNSDVRNVQVNITAAPKIQPEGQFISGAQTFTIDENTPIGTRLGTGSLYFNSSNLQAVFGAVSFAVTGAAADYIDIEVDGTPGDGNTATRVRTIYNIIYKLKESPDFEVYGATAKDFSVTATTAGTPSTDSVTVSQGGNSLTVRNVTELVRRNAVDVPDRTFNITREMVANTASLPLFRVDPSLYFIDDDPDPATRPVSYLRFTIPRGRTDAGRPLADVISLPLVAGQAPQFNITPVRAYYSTAQLTQEYLIRADQQGAPQARGTGTITINPYNPRPITSRYPSPVIFGRAYIDATSTSTVMDITAVIGNRDNRPLIAGFPVPVSTLIPTGLSATSSDELATYVISTNDDGHIICTATRQDTYTPQTETDTSNVVIHVQTTDTPNQNQTVRSNWLLEVTRPSS